VTEIVGVFVRFRAPSAEYGVILGSGLGSFTDDMEIALYCLQ
jgi:hypothetical protein